MVDQVLFHFKEYVQLWQTGGSAPNINGPMIQYNTTIYKGATNTIDFVVRNNDRKPVNLVGYQIAALIQRVEQPELLLEKAVVATDDRAGKARLVLTDAEIGDWLGGFYRYTIRLTDVAGKQEYLFTDVNRSTFGTFELVEGMSVALAPSLDLPASRFTPVGDNQYTNIFTTGSLAGDAQDNRANGMHTIVAYTSNNFIGHFWIQASLTTQAPTDVDWFDIPLTSTSTYFNYTAEISPSIKVFNLSGNYYWLRMFYKIDPTNHGSFDRILYKN